MINEGEQRRRIRSFVRREGRLTPGQARALERLWPRYGLDAEGAPLDLDALFGRAAPRVLEIGFGDGEALVHMAAAAAQQDFLGIEVHRPGVGRLLRRLEELGLDNVRVFCADATEVLATRIPPAALDAVHLFFPDPWPKKRHHKRRIVQPAFVQVLRGRLRIGGLFHMATDWEEYAAHMLEVMSAAEGFSNTAPEGGYVARPPQRPLTKFEARGHARGHGVWDLVFRRSA